MFPEIFPPHLTPELLDLQMWALFRGLARIRTIVLRVTIGGPRCFLETTKFFSGHISKNLGAFYIGYIPETYYVGRTVTYSKVDSFMKGFLKPWKTCRLALEQLMRMPWALEVYGLGFRG